jgi:hypothetical protein
MKKYDPAEAELKSRDPMRMFERRSSRTACESSTWLLQCIINFHELSKKTWRISKNPQ